jgi:cytochrome c biogenesis protein
MFDPARYGHAKEQLVITEKQFYFAAIADFFCSLRLTMFLLIGLAVVSIIGTIIPQIPNIPEEYLQSVSQAKLQFYDKLGFFDMYHSWWFVLLLALLTVNLLACSIKRFPGAWKLVTNANPVMDENLENTLRNTVVIKTSGSPAEISSKVAGILAEEFAAPLSTDQEGRLYLFAQKTPWCRLGVYVVHLSVIVIFIGAIVGSLFGYKGFVNVVEGESVDSFKSREDKDIKLGFALKCEKFSVSHYPTGAPKEFKSILTVLENGSPVKGYEQVPVIVNDPLSYKGITFYQSSYGKLGDHEFIVSNVDGSNPRSMRIKSGGSAKLPDGSGICLQETTADISQFQPGLSGPAAQVEVHLTNGANKTFIVYANNPAMNRLNLPYTGGTLLQYKGGEEFMYTGLQVAKDPGVWIVWLGCLLMIAGIYVAFFFAHKRIWIRIDHGSLTVAGHANKNQSAIQKDLERIVARINDQLAKEDSL